MYLKFAWRYFKAKKSTNAINIIAWITTSVIAFATCCQILVLSVFNGFEDVVKSLYSSFYSDIKISPKTGKTIVLTPQKIAALKKIELIDHLSFVVQEKALIQNGSSQAILQLKGVDNDFINVCGINKSVIKGKYDLGNKENPTMFIGAGLQYATGITLNEALGPERLTVLLPKRNVKSNEPLESISEGIISPTGIFSIQQEFDNGYAITNIDFLKQQMGMNESQFSGVEIKLKKNTNHESAKKEIYALLGDEVVVKNRFEQNANLYQTMKIEKWAIYIVLTLILVIAAFNMISALSMLVLEKKQDISILQSIGTTKNQIRNIFVTEGLLLGTIGTITGILLASLICFLQLKFKLIKLEGGSFLINYFPVKIISTDFIIVAVSSMLIVTMASWIPSRKAARELVTLK
jgi:lipoprotein-releasing system permease protein